MSIRPVGQRLTRMLNKRNPLTVIDCDGRNYNIVGYSQEEATIYARLVQLNHSNTNHRAPRVGDYMVLSNTEITLSVYISEFYASTAGGPLGIKFKFQSKDY